MKSVEEYYQSIRNSLKNDDLNLYTASIKMLEMKLAMEHFREKGLDLEEQTGSEQIALVLKMIEGDKTTDKEEIERVKNGILAYKEYAEDSNKAELTESI